ncbi:MAG TPA: hypothetical protein VLV25_03305 [Steroidobacteraceae bacterium]|nr:hypothetical protein [Steroidobacteraceae bacterium]
MQVRAVLFSALAAAGLWQAVNRWQLRAVHPPDGSIAPADPRQTDLEGTPVVANLGRWRLTPRARYDITARILSREDYHLDALSDLIPEDLALGWGPMSDNRVLSAFEVTQGARFYSWMPTQPDLPIPRQAVIEHSANTHVIPADAATRRQLERLRVGQVVHLKGLLVDGVRDDGAYIHTSLTRSDTGPGACEVMLVEQAEVEPPNEG